MHNDNENVYRLSIKHIVIFILSAVTLPLVIAINVVWMKLYVLYYLFKLVFFRRQAAFGIATGDDIQRMVIPFMLWYDIWTGVCTDTFHTAAA